MPADAGPCELPNGRNPADRQRQEANHCRQRRHKAREPHLMEYLHHSLEPVRRFSNNSLVHMGKKCGPCRTSSMPFTNGTTIFVTLFKVSPAAPMNPRVAPTHNAMFNNAATVSHIFLKKKPDGNRNQQKSRGNEKWAISLFMYSPSAKSVTAGPAK